MTSPKKNALNAEQFGDSREEGEHRNPNPYEGETMNPIITSTPDKFEVCPRCTGPIEIKGTSKFAARSRATDDRSIEICSPCGSDEALRQYATGQIVPVSAWPLQDPHSYHRPVQEAIDEAVAL